MKRLCLSIASVLVCVIHSSLAAQPDILIADFEGSTYGDWKVTGQAFGPGPAKGTLPSQMPVSGYAGQGLVNSYYGGDGATGRLLLPEFRVERRYIAFLIGGGGWEGKTCFNLLVRGQVVRSATGPNTRAGGSEELSAQCWDVGDLAGQTAQLEIVDDATGGWGHINVDQIRQTDLKPPGLVSGASREFTVAKRYLNLPVRTGAPKRKAAAIVDGRAVREFDIELADSAPEWWAFLDLADFKGKVLTLRIDKLPEDSSALRLTEQSDRILGTENLYHEPLRSQFHFSSRRGWNNDPNGLVYYKGEYHLFYQHNPYGWDWGNMHWGHAVSPDLVHWREFPIALYPDQHGTMFSGSAVVDWNNTAGFQTGREKPLICVFTAAGRPFTQGLAFSNDRGRSWTKYSGNPVLPHIVAENRDPKVFWYEPGRKWVMALYLDKADFAIFGSADLKNWTRLGGVTIPGTSECPEFFELPVEGNRRETRWVFYGGNGRYLVGSFDGNSFAVESGPHDLNYGNCFYASQTYNDLPAKDGRRILVPWGQISTPGMPFNQMMGLPVELTLRTTESGLRLFVSPVAELRSLRGSVLKVKPQPLAPGANPLEKWSGELAEVVAELSPGHATEVGFELRGVPITYDPQRQELTCGGKKATLKPAAGKIQLHIFVDRTSVDIFGNEGALYMPMGVIVPRENRSAEMFARGGEAQIHSLRLYTLKPAWR